MAGHAARRAVLCHLQHFGAAAEIKRDLAKWAEATGKSVLLADSGGKHVLPDKTERQDATVYREIMTAMRELSACVGFQLCGAYLKNRIRRKGLRDEREQPDAEAIAGITAVNRETQSWLRQQRIPSSTHKS